MITQHHKTKMTNKQNHNEATENKDTQTVGTKKYFGTDIKIISSRFTSEKAINHSNIKFIQTTCVISTNNHHNVLSFFLTYRNKGFNEAMSWVDISIDKESKGSIIEIGHTEDIKPIHLKYFKGFTNYAKNLFELELQWKNKEIKKEDYLNLKNKINQNYL